MIASGTLSVGSGNSGASMNNNEIESISKDEIKAQKKADKAEKKRKAHEIANFIKTLHSILTGIKHSDVIKFADNKIVIENVSEFTKVVLPSYF